MGGPAAVLAALVLAADAAAGPYAAALPTPAAARLVVTSSVNYGTEGAATVAPELSVTTPDGRRVGFDRTSGADRAEVPGASYAREGSSEDSDDPSDTGGPRHLQVPHVPDGTYLLEVIATTPGRYSLGVVGALEGNGARSSTTRTLRDVPMTAGEVHRYRVRLAPEDGAVRLVVVREGEGARPAPRRLPHAPTLWISLGTACSAGAPLSVRVALPDGRAVTRGPGFPAMRGPQGIQVQDVDEAAPEKHDRHLEVANPPDGEYAIEIAASGGPTPYFVHLELDADGVEADAWPWELADCARLAIAPGTIHRWTFRLRAGAEAPLRVVSRPPAPPVALPSPGACPDAPPRSQRRAPVESPSPLPDPLPR